jgi:hypothetical protein
MRERTIRRCSEACRAPFASALRVGRPAVGLALRGTLLAPYQRAAVRRGGIVRSATATEPISDHAGRVRCAGREWRALSSGHFIPGTKVTVTGLADETTLLVYPKEVVQQAVTISQREPAHRVSWREASKARGKLSGGYSLTPEERLRLANVSYQRWRYIDRLWGRVMVSFVGLVSAFILALSPLGLVPAIRAAQGAGVRGIFIAQTLSCSRTCQWTGTFTSADQIVHDVVYDDALPASTHAGSMVPAQYPGGYGSKEVFAVHGSTTWHVYVVLIPWPPPGSSVVSG